MPYGCMSFRCERCGEELFTYHLYCSYCGAKQPEMKEVRSFRGESDVDIINAELNRTRGWKARLWSYCASHSELEIRLQRPGENLTLMCIGSFSISTPVYWTSTLAIAQQKDDIYNRTVFLIQDEPAEVVVKCWMVRLFYNVPPVY